MCHACMVGRFDADHNLAKYNVARMRKHLQLRRWRLLCLAAESASVSNKMAEQLT